MIDIYCPDIDSVYCFLIVYNPQLLDHEFESDHKVDESSEQTKTQTNFTKEKNHGMESVNNE
jgi:hypothetical protein